MDNSGIVDAADYGHHIDSHKKIKEEISMLDKIAFWEHQYRKWKRDCYRELLDKGYRPGDWEISECGSIYFKENPFINAKNMVTPWRESIHYVD